MEVQEIVISYFRQGKSQRQIARSLNIHRRTVKKYIEKHQNDLQTGQLSPPQYSNQNRKKIKLTDAVIVVIEQCLKINEQRCAQGLHKQQMKAIDIFEQLESQGFDIGYTSVCNYVRSQKQRSREKFIKQHYLPGKVVEFDWGTVKLRIGGQLQKLKMGIFTLACSNHRFAMLFQNEQMNSFLEIHTHYFAFIDGVPVCIVYDNMKTAVAKFTIKQKDKKPTDDLLKMSTYYAFDFRFANAGKGNEKGHVERSVEYVRRKCFAAQIDFEDIQQANIHLLQKLKMLNQKTGNRLTKSIAELFASEQKYFKTLPVNACQTALTKTCSINKYHTICLASNFYSLPESYNHKEIELKIYSDQIFMYDKQNQIIAQHKRGYGKNEWIIDINHYLFTLKTKPGALPCSYALKQAPQILQNIYYKHDQNNNKSFIETARQCHQYGYDLNQWKEAIRLYKSKTNNAIDSSIIIATIQQKTNNPKNVNQKSELNNQITKASNQQLKQLQQIF